MKGRRLFLSIVLIATYLNGQSRKNMNIEEMEIRKREILGAKIGNLICLDDYGNYIICAGDEFEKILGFCTNTPYITVNKAKGDNKITEHKGLASFAKGKIVEGDYLCPCEENPGQVVRCEKTDYPYAKAMEAPDKKGALFKVKILGHRREH